MMDLRKNWVQYNGQTFQALHMMTSKARKTAESDPNSYSILQALETSEMLMVSEYSFEMTFNQRFKS